MRRFGNPDSSQSLTPALHVSLTEMRIRAKCRTRVLQLGITCILFATSLLAQKETFAPANDVSFTVSAERRSYKVGEQITLKYRVTSGNLTSTGQNE
jgi:uncharacterized protein (DUF58 family)